ncbi:MAG: 50S ribosomal protein L17 [Armatimonadota bacterium]|nr:50S ribosomal protein L17 [Armatimonadota bacterium]MDR7452652.1 50S ribosomal protein L17 [Armatimonadota bacterium]MDR7468163.1 50S ribosomal protein L17 [Armatimonadota bacterium]MDR7495157.1 50S ribosomal protein L17 [Armatimonadota bacterium]MDR7499291.1 50S ribosomal protein L17 [Armatimonadota bacterium]
MLGRVTRKLNRDSGERKALFRDLVSALITHGRIETTAARAKETKKIADGLVALALRDDVHARRQARRLLTDPAVVKRLFAEVAPRYRTRVGRGGYTRVIRTRARRGDASEMAIVELVS